MIDITVAQVQKTGFATVPADDLQRLRLNLDRIMTASLRPVIHRTAVHQITQAVEVNQIDAAQHKHQHEHIHILTQQPAFRTHIHANLQLAAPVGLRPARVQIKLYTSHNVYKSDRPGTALTDRPASLGQMAAACASICASLCPTTSRFGRQKSANAAQAENTVHMKKIPSEARHRHRRFAPNWTMSKEQP